MTLEALDDWRAQLKLLIVTLESHGVPATADEQHLLMAALLAMDRRRREMVKKAEKETTK